MTRPVRIPPVALRRSISTFTPLLTKLNTAALSRSLEVEDVRASRGLATLKAKYFLPARFDLFLPVPRAKVTVPVAPKGEVTSSTVFEAPDPSSSQRFVVPEFRLSERILDDRSTFEVSLRQLTATTSQLTVQFSKSPRAGGDPLEGDVGAELRFVSGGAQQSVELAVTADGDNYTAVRDIANNNERDEVYRALVDAEGRTDFVVAYRCEYARPVDGRPGMYLIARRTVDVELDRRPFVFDPAQHAYVFEGISGVGTTPADVIDRTVAWQGRTHHYFQSAARPAEFSYLPDAVKVARRTDGDVWRPAITVSFASGDGTLATTRASVVYEAAPEYDAERLAAAQDALAAHVPTIAGATPEVALRPLVVADSAQLRLAVAVPPPRPGAPTMVDRPGVVTSLTDPFHDLLGDLPMTAFQQIFDALFGESGIFLTGGLHVAGGGGRPEVVVPFSGRLDDLAGPVVEVTPTSAGVEVLNRCESPVVVAALPAVAVADDGTTRPAAVGELAVDGAAVTLPVTLAPGARLAAAVEAAPAADGPAAATEAGADGEADGEPEAVGDGEAGAGAGPDGEADGEAEGGAEGEAGAGAGAAPVIAVDLSGITAVPDADAVWAAIVDPSVPAVYERVVQVVAFDSMFAPATDVQAIVIDFAHGGSVMVRPGQLEGTASVQAPLADVVLRRGADSTYTYTQVTVRGDGQVRRSKSDTLDLLVPQADPAEGRDGP